MGFCSEFFSRCRDCARRRRYFLVVEQESTQRNRPCCSRPSADAPGNLPQSTDPARRGTPAALSRSGQTAAASQWLKLLRHLTQQPPDRLPEAGVIRRELGAGVNAQLFFVDRWTSEFPTPKKFIHVTIRATPFCPRLHHASHAVAVASSDATASSSDSLRLSDQSAKRVGSFATHRVTGVMQVALRKAKGRGQ